MMVKVFLSLGSNIGDRLKYLEKAFYELAANPQIKLVDQSSIYETKPEGYTDQDDFLNMVVAIATTLSPSELFNYIQDVELRLGRERNKHWGPRTIDIDILIYGEEIIENERLIIPHKLMHERVFVLLPLYEIYQGLIPGIERSIPDLILDYQEQLPGISVYQLV